MLNNLLIIKSDKEAIPSVFKIRFESIEVNIVMKEIERYYKDLLCPVQIYSYFFFNFAFVNLILIKAYF